MPRRQRKRKLLMPRKPNKRKLMMLRKHRSQRRSKRMTRPKSLPKKRLHPKKRKLRKENQDPHPRIFHYKLETFSPTAKLEFQICIGASMMKIYLCVLPMKETTVCQLNLYHIRTFQMSIL